MERKMWMSAIVLVACASEGDRSAEATGQGLDGGSSAVEDLDPASSEAPEVASDAQPLSGACERFAGTPNPATDGVGRVRGLEGVITGIAVVDMNGDGLDDLFVGSPEANEGHGAVYLFLAPFGDELRLDQAVARFEGVKGDGAGASLIVDDVDQDGVPDLWIGAPDANGSAGRVYLAHGPFQGRMDLGSAPAWEGFVDSRGAGARAGMRIDAVGDVTGDRRPDLVIGGGAGEAWVVSGPVHGRPALLEEADAALVGAEPLWSALAVRGAGDMDGDGVADLLVGSYGDGGTGRAYLLTGPVQGYVSLAEQADAVFAGGSDNLNFGVTVDVVPDMTGDGLPDVWVADLYAGPGRRGAAYLFDGTWRGSLETGDAHAVVRGRAEDLLGLVASAGDLDGDGFGDVVISGVPTYTDSDKVPGFSSVWYGPLAGTYDVNDAAALIYGVVAGAALSPRFDGDLDGDGCTDLWLGSPYTGAVVALLGPKN